MDAIEKKLSDLEERVSRLERNGETIAHLMSTLGGKFKSVRTGVLTKELAEFFDEVGRTLSSVNKK